MATAGSAGLRGLRASVFALPTELNAWYASPDARRARAESGPESDPQAGAPPTEPVVEERPAGHSRPWLRFAWAGLAGVVVFGVAAWVWTGLTGPSPTLPERTSNGPFGVARAADEPTLRVGVADKAPFTITARPGDLVRFEIDAQRLGLATRADQGRVRFEAFRLTPYRDSEALKTLVTRWADKGAAQTLEADGVTLTVTWLSTDARPGVPTPGEKMPSCRILCEGVNACGLTVDSRCGRCKGLPDEGPSRARTA